MTESKYIFLAPLLLLCYINSALCYPNSYYGSKRYSRSLHKPTYDDDYYLNQNYPYGYYPTYSQYYPEEYYYSEDTYPMYYIPPRSAPKYDFYKTTSPYYYQDIPLSRVRSKYNYYNYQDPRVGEQQRLLQEFEREQRENSQPIGHEIRYENDYNNDDDDEVDVTNAAFLNNLMMQQMYQDKASTYYDQYHDAFYNSDEADTTNFPTKWDDIPYDRPVNVEDEDERELKDLSNKKQKQRKNKQRKQRKLKTNNIDSNESPTKRSQDNLVFTDRKPVTIVNSIPSTAAPSEGSKRDVRGQKEEVLMRPATPVRHPFSDSVLDMINQQEERKRSPSVYDTIRHMLEMEKKYEENHPENKPEIKQTMKKRIVSSEDSLTRQLSVLKKAQ